MSWIAALWGPDAEALRATEPGWSRPALEDQGPYASGTPFNLLVGGAGAAPTMDWSVLGQRVFAWTVEETAVINSGFGSPPEVTMVSLMRRNPAMDHAEFVAHWLDCHAPLAKRRHIGLTDYRQCVVTETLTLDTSEIATSEIDGVALLGFSSRHDFDTRFFDSDEGRAEIMADVARFMDRPGPETTLVGPPG